MTTQHHSKKGPFVFAPDELELEPEADRFDGDTAATDLSMPMHEGKKRFGFGKLLFGSLISLGVALITNAAISQFVAALNTNSWFSWVVSALYILVLISLVGLIAREAFGLLRLSHLQSLKAEWSLALASGTHKDGEKALKDLRQFLSKNDTYKHSLQNLRSYDQDIIDGKARLALAEKLLFAAPDEQAQRLISASAKRVTVVTAASPRALIDMAYVGFESLKLIRSIAQLYGARPTTTGLLKLVRMTVGNLAISGGIAVTDGLMEQVLGHGAAARLSARFGEGVLNGFLITRIGLAATLACRPVAFEALPKPKLADLAKSLISRKSKD